MSSRRSFGNASSGRIALLPGACWAQGASKMTNALYLQYLIVQEVDASARRVSHKPVLPPGAFYRPEPLCFLPAPLIPLVPPPTSWGLQGQVRTGNQENDVLGVKKRILGGCCHPNTNYGRRV